MMKWNYCKNISADLSWAGDFWKQKGNYDHLRTVLREFFDDTFVRKEKCIRYLHNYDKYPQMNSIITIITMYSVGECRNLKTTTPPLMFFVKAVYFTWHIKYQINLKNAYIGKTSVTNTPRGIIKTEISNLI